MKMEWDTLKHARLLVSRGFTSAQAEGLITSFSESEVKNIYTKLEINAMLSESVKEVFEKADKRLEEQRREFDKRLKEQRREQQERAEDRRREFDRRCESFERQATIEIAELRAGRRWIISTIITVGLGLAMYLSALIHFVVNK